MCGGTRYMKRRIIQAAEGSSKGAEAFEEAVANMEDNFSYVVEGLEKLSRDGGESQNEALQLTLEMNSAIEGITQKIAGKIMQ